MKTFIHYISFKKIFFLLITLILFYECSPIGKSLKSLSDYISLYDFNLKNRKNILILSDKTCPSCTKSFSKIVSEYIDNKNSLIIVSSNGNRFDISNYLTENNNVIIDYEKSIDDLNISKGSSAIFIKNNSIDTIVDINVQNLEQRLNYISSRLEH